LRLETIGPEIELKVIVLLRPYRHGVALEVHGDLRPLNSEFVVGFDRLALAPAAIRQVAIGPDAVLNEVELHPYRHGIALKVRRDLGSAR
jgi:hypothetical protein